MSNGIGEYDTIQLSSIHLLVRDKQIQIKEDTEVACVRKLGERNFAVKTKSGKSFPTRQVLVAIGRQGQSRLLESPGADKAHKVTYRLHTPEDYQDKEILVVGGGNSAIEAALLLMGHNRVSLSYRGQDFFRAKEENRRLVERAERDGHITVLYQSNWARRSDHPIVDTPSVVPRQLADPGSPNREIS